MEEKSPKKNILIVEDEKGLVLSLNTLLKSQGYLTIIANDSLYGIKMAHKEKPDLIILDLGLPAGGGFQVLRNLKESTNTNDIPILVLTGNREPGMEERVRQAGAAAFMHKPFEPDVLSNKIKEILINK